MRAMDFNFVIPRCAIAHLRMRLLGAGPESITPAGSMDSGLVLRTPRNDERKIPARFQGNDSNFKQPNTVIASEAQAIHEATRKQEWIASLRSQ
jgi:hypothetical protein